MTTAHEISVELRGRLAAVRLLAMDVDGVLTDGTLACDSAGGESKRFHVADGLGLTALRVMGCTIAWISGRESAAVTRRAAELHIPYLVERAGDKKAALKQLLDTLSLSPEQLAYIGDDWNDLPAFEAAGVRIAPANACAEIRARADIVTQAAGGQGAVREVCEMLLEASGKKEAAIRNYLEHLARPASAGKNTQ